MEHEKTLSVDDDSRVRWKTLCDARAGMYIRNKFKQLPDTIQLEIDRHSQFSKRFRIEEHVEDDIRHHAKPRQRLKELEEVMSEFEPIVVDLENELIAMGYGVSFMFHSWQDLTFRPPLKGEFESSVATARTMMIETTSPRDHYVMLLGYVLWYTYAKISDCFAELQEEFSFISARLRMKAEPFDEWAGTEDQFDSLMQYLRNHGYLIGEVEPFDWQRTYPLFMALFDELENRKLLVLPGNQRCAAFFCSHFLKKGKSLTKNSVRTSMNSAKLLPSNEAAIVKDIVNQVSR